jgi:DNA-binding GntR family transcriptional regulator
MTVRTRRPSGTRTNDPPLAQAAYAALRQSIVRCELEPGRQFTEAEIAQRYGIGKATVRVVLSRLAQDRLVQVLPREGYLVAPITLKQIQDLCGARIVLEPPVARLAAGRLDDTQLAELRALNEVRYDIAQPASITPLLEANTRFHVAIARATGNDRLATMVADLLGEMERVLHFGYTLGDRNQETYHEHAGLLDALAAGDGERAERLVHEHLVFDRRVLLEALLTSPGLQSVNLARSS